MRRLGIVASVLTLVLGASSAAFATHSPSAQREVIGEYNKAQYALFLPYRWNGDLVVYAHGFIDPAVKAVALPDTAPVDVAPWVVELRERLLQAGAAAAYSSYSQRGWAKNDGAQRTRELRPLFSWYFSVPDRTYVIGRSLGALTTMLLVEKYAIESSPSISILGISLGGISDRAIDGALALCGPVGGGRKQTDYVAHTRALFDFFYPIGVDGKPVIPGDVLHVPAGLDYSSTSLQVQAIVGAILANPQAAVALASIDQVELPWTSFPELINTIVRVLGYNILGTNDLLARTGGASPFENRSVTYTGLGAYDAVVNAGVDRFAGSTQAFNYLKAYYQPTGNLKANVLTLHTTLDPDVPFTHEQALKDIVVRYTNDSTPNKLAQQNYNRYGHCNFTPAETVDAFFRLVNWVERGVKPANGALAP